MTYATDAHVRRYAGNASDADAPSADVTQFITWADNQIDLMMGGSALKHFFKKIIRDQDKYITVSSSAISAIQEVRVNGVLIPEYQLNLLENPEAEDGTDGSPDDWTTVSTASNTTYTWATATVFKGHRSLQITKSGADTTSAYYSDSISVEEKKMYRAEGYIKTSSLTGNVYLRIAWYDSSDSLIQNDDSTAVSADQDFTLVTVDAVAPYNANYCKVYFMHQGTAGDAYIDNMKFRKRNWKEDTTNYAVDMNTHLKNGDSFTASMLLSTAPTAVIEAASALAAVKTLFLVNGIDSSGPNFQALKTEVASAGQPQFQRLAYSLLNIVEENINLLKNYGSNENIDFVKGESPHIGRFRKRPPSWRGY